MDNDRFKRWIECQQGLKWSTTPIVGPGSRMKMDNHIDLHTKGVCIRLDSAFNKVLGLKQVLRPLQSCLINSFRTLETN